MSLSGKVGTTFRWAFGTTLPLFAFGFEFLTHGFSGGLYDIMPTPWHALLWLCIPAGFVLAELQLGQRSSSLKWISSFLNGVILPVILLHLVAVGGIAVSAFLMLGLILIHFVILSFDVALDLLRSFAANSLIALTPLMLLSLWIWNCRQHVPSRPVNASLLCAGAGLLGSALFLAFLEMSAVQTRGVILSTIHQIENGREPSPHELNLLCTLHSQQAIARLVYSGHQFSSASELYAVGPVDIFGPLAFILDGRRVPTYASDRLVMKQSQMLRLFKLTHPGDPSAKPAPWSWRGLSPGERARLKSE
ncbi:hypothetical protein [Brevifollis gellanilyticus]|uniref:hypothetical protein n=1 Tax=Brevifollis gellanilyticus TaxID=748831 RepID=UPI0011BF5C65|nr:hypothetical protein [Brevifollis gellanilyticus]